jgi:hypothetical protein
VQKLLLLFILWGLWYLAFATRTIVAPLLLIAWATERVVTGFRFHVVFVKRGKMMDVYPGLDINFEAITELFRTALEEGRSFLFEYEVYNLLARSAVRRILYEVPENFVQWLNRNPDAVHEAYRGLTGEALVTAIRRDVKGVLMVQYMPPDSGAFGNELIVGLRNTREFGMVISAGLGGTDTELYAKRCGCFPDRLLFRIVSGSHTLWNKEGRAARIVPFGSRSSGNPHFKLPPRP